MDTRVEKIDFEQNFNQAAEAMKAAATFLRDGELVAFPTETVYGLGGDGLNPEASKKIYSAKGRPSDNPLILHIADFEAVEKLAKKISPAARKLMDAFWPGPMTLIFEKTDIVPLETTGGLNTVAIRFPNHPVAQKMIRESGLYIAAPSANLSGRPSPTKAEHVIEDLNGRIAMILDGGESVIGLESTIIDVSEEVPVVLRPGYITKHMLEDVIGEVKIDPAIVTEKIQPGLKAKAPGMKYKHYAPKGQLTLVESRDFKKVQDTINRLVKEQEAQEKKVAVLATKENKAGYQAHTIVEIGSRADDKTIAHHLFDCLRQMDQMQMDVIYCESFSRDDLGQAIMNRLLKAAGYQVLRLDEQ